jgi:hypothetical protein
MAYQASTPDLFSCRSRTARGRRTAAVVDALNARSPRSHGGSGSRRRHLHATLIAWRRSAQHLRRAYLTTYLFPDHREGSSDAAESSVAREHSGPTTSSREQSLDADYYLGRTDGFRRQRRG